MNAIQQLKNTVQQVRRDILRMVHKVNSGHPGGSLGCAEFLVVLYKDVMVYNTDFSMDGIGEDLFFFPMATSRRFIIAFLLEVVSSLSKNSIRFDCWTHAYKVIQLHTKSCQESELPLVLWGKGCRWQLAQQQQKNLIMIID